MTVIYLGDGNYEGVSGDVKPTTASTNSSFFETNTGKTFIYNGSSWVLGTAAVYDTNTVTTTNKTIDSVTNTISNLGVFKYSIFRSGSNTVCRNNLTGVIESSSTTPETVFQYALNNSVRSSIFVQNGNYSFSGGFTGLTFSQLETTIVLENGALLFVPSGYTGKLWIFTETSSVTCKVIGGRYSETASVGRGWTFAHFEVAEGNLTLHVIRDVYVRFCGKFIEFKITGTNGWINGLTVENSFCDEFIQGIVFNQVSAQNSTNGANRNHFSNIIFQSNSTLSTDGVINISGVSNFFDDVKVWDLQASGHGCTISANATDTIIFGGIMKASNGFSDAGVRTKIIENTNIILPSATLVSPTITTPTFSAALSKAQIPSTTIFNDQANSFGVFNQNFRSGTLGLTNPANTFLYQFAGSAITATRTVTLPLLTAGDEFVMKDFGQTVTTKTINVSNNTLTDTSTALGDILKSDGTKFTKLARGTTNYVLTSTGSDIAWQANAAAAGPVTGKKFGRFDGTASLSGSGIFAGGFTATGTANGVVTSTTNGDASRFTSGAVAGNTGGFRYVNAYTTRAWNPYLGIRFKIGTATNNRVIAGWNNGTVPTDGNDDPLLNLSGVMLVQRSTDTTFQISTNAGTATSTFVNTGVTVDNTTVYTFEIRADAVNNKFQWSLNGSAWADLTSNIPSATFYMAFMALIQTAEAVAHTVDIFAVETVSDK